MTEQDISHQKCSARNVRQEDRNSVYPSAETMTCNRIQNRWN